MKEIEAPPNYALLDFGNGRKLESLSGYLLDRPCPAAEGFKRMSPKLWAHADAIYLRQGSQSGWKFHQPWPGELVINAGTFQMPAQPTPFGHIGLFPEQQPNWDWISKYVVDAKLTRVLNLFSYTGASTLAAASAGAHVTHVDAAKPNVEAAKRAALCSGLQDAPIRYIVDDARKWVEREKRRKQQYDLIVLDPPAYGHGRSGEAWRLERDLWPLLSECLSIQPQDRGGMIITGHSAVIGHREVRDWVQTQHLPHCKMAGGRAGTQDSNKRILDAGFFLRVLWGRNE